MKMLNCAPVLALVVGGLVASTTVNAASFNLNPTSISASHDILNSTSLSGHSAFRRLSSNQQQQQQQQQQQRPKVAIAGLVYDAPLSGFNV